MKRPCPACGSNWDGGPIPKDIQHLYSPPHRWGREISIDGGALGIYDGVVAVQCPDCKKYFPRNRSRWACEMFLKFKKEMKYEV